MTVLLRRSSARKRCMRVPKPGVTPHGQLYGFQSASSTTDA
jgi:hypothetical protein